MRKAQTTPHSQATAPQVKKADGASKVDRDGVSNTRQGVNVKSTWPGCEVELGTCHCLPYYVHLVHTRIPGLSSPTTETILCGGDPPRGLSDETTSLGTMATAMERKPTPALPLLAPGRLLLGDSLQKGSKGVVQQGELQGLTPSYPTASSQGIGFHRRLRVQVALLPDPSGHTRGCLE